MPVFKLRNLCKLLLIIPSAIALVVPPCPAAPPVEPKYTCRDPTKTPGFDRVSRLLCAGTISNIIRTEGTRLKTWPQGHYRWKDDNVPPLCTFTLSARYGGDAKFRVADVINTADAIFHQCDGQSPKGYGGWGHLVRTGTGEIFRYWTLNVAPKHVMDSVGGGELNVTEMAWKESDAFDNEENECGVINSADNMAASVGTS